MKSSNKDSRRDRAKQAMPSSLPNWKIVRVIFGVVCGAVAGLGLGVSAAVGLGLWSQWTNPGDPSAGSVAIVVIATAPMGILLGSVFGGLTIANRPRLFWCTILPLATFFVLLQATVSTLRDMDRPRHYVVDVKGTPGAAFVGIVSVDGEAQRLKGVIPANFEYDGSQMELAFVLENQNGDDLAVEVSANGKTVERAVKTQTGCHQSLKSFGYSEHFGGTSGNWSRMSEEEAKDFLSDSIMPE